MIGLFESVVEIETRPGCRGYVQITHQRLRAVVAGADSDAFHVESRSQVMRMYPF